MRDDFAIFILTHGRAEKQVTYKALRDAGYTGKVYFVIDNLDEQGEKYKELYGDNVIVFDKEKEYSKTDTFTCEKNLLAVVYARNACFEIAKSVGVKWFINCDDDIISFFYRVPVDGKLTSVKIKRMDDLIESFIEFMSCSGVECMSIAANGIYVAGAANGKVVDGCQWSFAHFYMFNAESELRFKSIWLEDLIFSISKQKLGYKMLSTTLVSQVLPSLEAVQKNQKGGMRDNYESSSNWINEFTPLITAPDCLKMVRKDGRWKSRKSKDNFMVKYVSDRWKK